MGTTQQMIRPDFMISANKIYRSAGASIGGKATSAKTQWDELVKKNETAPRVHGVESLFHFSTQINFARLARN